MAFIREINPNSIDSHQTSPAYQLTFLRWFNRDTKNFDSKPNTANPHPKDTVTEDYLEMRKPLVVISDCIQVSVSSTKSSHIHQANMILLAGDINYSTAIAPGDFVLINLVNDDAKLFGVNKTPNTAEKESLYYRARTKQPINKKDDGFKGIFKVQQVRRVLMVNPEGAKTFHYQISAAAFTEFNQVVYFNPYLFTDVELKSASNTLNAGATLEWASINKVTSNVGKIFQNFVGFLIGEGFGHKILTQTDDSGVVRNHNQSFHIPPDAAALMGISTNKQVLAADLFNYYVGIQEYGNVKDNKSHDKDKVGLNPNLKLQKGNFYTTGKELSGVALIQAEPWGQVTAWSILNQYSNSLINETYTSFKLMPDDTVMPCVVFRQKPFTSDSFRTKYKIPSTPFLNLPRWKISPYLITSLSLGRDEAARINFVHIVGKTRYIDQKNAGVQQAASNLHQHDDDDIRRNGLRPFISACDFDFPSSESKDMQAGNWNLLMFDWLTNGHLKENGTIVCAGLPENIAVGDNLQVEDTAFHIESIQHTLQLSPDGKKNFTTTMQLSYGVSVESSNDFNKIYPEMTRVSAEAYRNDEYSKDAMLPGFSDSQEIGGRPTAEKTTRTPDEKVNKTKAKTLPTK